MSRQGFVSTRKSANEPGRGTQTDARMQRGREISLREPVARAVCLSSRSAPFNMNSTRRKCGADEGQMREWIGYLVAHGGAEQAVARTAVGIPQRYLCGEDRAYRAHASMDASIGVLDGFDVCESI